MFFPSHSLLASFTLFALAAVGALLGESRLRAGFLKSVALVAPVALLAACIGPQSSPGWAIQCGICFGVGYVGRMLLHLRLPVVITAALGLSQILVWTVFSVGAWRLVSHGFPLSAITIACLGTSLFWLEWSVLPLWGTAQNFANSFPFARAVGASLGAAGSLWCLLLVAALLACTVTAQSSAQELQSGISLVGVLLLIGVGDWLSRPKLRQTLRVATFGWGENAPNTTPLLSQYQEAAREASEKGARLLVTPESAIAVEDRVHFRVVLCSLAQRYNIALAVGYFDQQSNENCVDLVSAEGEVMSRYIKTHLVPAMEDYTKGIGATALMEVDDVKVGALICQDDNFPDIARKYARAGTQLLVVPTNDWENVKDVHFANHLWRALEFRFALTRAASRGISALTSADGRVERLSNHFKNGAHLLVADVRVGTGRPTFYARMGDWFPVVCGGLALVGLFLAR